MHDWNRFFCHILGNLNNSVYLIFDPERKPEILEWFASEKVTPAQKEAFIYALTHFNDGCGDFFRYRAYFLAAEAINHFKTSTQADAIVHQLLLWSYAYFRQNKRDWKIYPPALISAARDALERTDRDRVIARFEHLLHTTDSRTILRVAAEKLGKYDPGNRCAIAALECLMQKEQTLAGISKRSPRQLFATVDRLLKIAPNHPAIVPALLKLIETPIESVPHGEYRWIEVAVFRLEEVAGDHQAVIAKLLDLLKQWKTQEISVYRILQTIGKIAKGNSDAIQVLMEIIQALLIQAESLADREAEMLPNCLEELSVIAVQHPGAIAFLTQMLHNEQNFEHQSLLAAALAWIDPGNEEAIAILTQTLETYLPQILPPRFSIIRLIRRAALGLLQSDLKHPLAIDALCCLGRSLLTYDTAPPRELLKLREIDPLYQVEQEILLRLVETSQPEDRLWAAINRLSRLGVSDDRSIAAMMHVVQSTQNAYSLSGATNFLKSLQSAPALIVETVVPKLVQIIRSTHDDNEREDAAHCLAELMPGHSLAIATLIHIWERARKSSALWRLARLGNFDETVVDVLNTCLQTDPFGLPPYQELKNPFREISSIELQMRIVQRLKPFLDVEVHHPGRTGQLSGLRSRTLGTSAEEIFVCPAIERTNISHQIIWDCAQNMSYSDFCRVWYQMSLRAIA